MNEHKPRRSAGMRGSPGNPVPEHGAISTTPKMRDAAPETKQLSSSAYPQPKVLMGEVAIPKAQHIAAEREHLRAFMRAHRLSPTAWAGAAGVSRGELLSFLSGQSRELAPATLERLAAAAGVSASALLQK